MAPATKQGYALLPQDDIQEAGGPVNVPRVASRATSEDYEQGKKAEHKTANELMLESAKRVQYDGGRRYDMSVGDCVIHPFNRCVQVWNAALICLLIFDVLFLPVETAFGYAMPQHLMFWFNMSSTGLFSMDIILQFFLQIPSPTGDYWVFNHAKIVQAYITGFFFIDILSVLPFNEIYAVIGYETASNTSQTVYMLRVMRFMKLLRMIRLKRIARRYEYDMNLSFTQRAVAYICITIFLSLHILSCLWATIGNYQIGDDWENYVLQEKLLSTGRAQHDDMRGAETPLVKYIISMYFSLYTLTGIGYGDIVPSTVFEYSFVIGVMLTGSLIWASIIGEIVGVIKNANVDEVEYQETMDQLLAMNAEYKIPKGLQKRLRAFFSQARITSHQTFIKDHVMAKMSSELAVQLTHVLHGEWFNNIWWLKGVSRTSFMVQLTLAFEMMLYCPNEMIRTTDRLYVIARGLCIHGSQLLSKNKCWGVDFLLAQDYLRIQVATVALSYLHTLYLTRDALHDTLERYPREQQLIRRAYRSLCVMRGILWYAKRIRAEEKRKERQQLLDSGQVVESEDSGDFLEKMGHLDERPENVMVVQSSNVFETRCTPEHMKHVVAETKEMLGVIEKEMNARISRVEDEIHEATEMISTFILKRKGGKGSR
mmetsp:Transcript_6629/g.10549  ORF Transcript_6629/g.10549 Transcript_6629/m.10549 type:complete len:654 (-) Transcript_6629:50-2011(-)